MKIYINDQPYQTSTDEITVSQLLAERNVKPGGTAVAINNRLVMKGNWDTTYLSPDDMVVIISATFGG